MICECNPGEHSRVLGQQQQKPIHHSFCVEMNYLEMIIRTDAAASATVGWSVNIDQLKKV